MLNLYACWHRCRRALVVYLALYMMLFSFPLEPVSAEVAPVTLTIGSVTDKIGSTAEITVKASSFQNISGGNFDMVYDPAIADVIASADILKGSALNSGFLFTRFNKKSDNTLSVAWAGDGSQSIAAGGEICRIRFSLLQTGTAQLSLQNVALKDAAGSSIADVSLVGGSITVEDSSIYPEISIAGVADGANYSAAVTPVINVNNGSITELSLTRGNGASVSYTSGTSVSESGTYLLHVKANNDASNRITTSNVYFTIGTSLIVSTAPGGIDSTVEIPVIAANFLNISGGNFDLVYDPNIADVLVNSDILKGSALTDRFMFTRNNKKSDNTLSVAWAGDGTQSIAAGGEICRIRFHLLKTGTVNLSLLNAALKDGAASAINNIILTNGRIDVAASNAYPNISVTGVINGGNYSAAVTPVINVSEGSSITELDLKKDNGEALSYTSSTPITDVGAFLLHVKAVNDSSGLSSTTDINFTIGTALVVSTTRSKINNTIEITVKAVNFDTVQGGSFDLVYNPDIADVLVRSDILKGSDLTDGFLFTPNNKKASNILSVAWGATSECIGAGGEICRIRFATKNAGSALLQLQNVSLKDANLNSIQSVALESGNIQVYQFNNDATLSSLQFSGIEFLPNFTKDIKSYTAVVDNAVTSTTISAAATDVNAVIDTSNLGEKALQEGKNVFMINVTSEDGSKDVYTVTITREEKTDECFIATAAFGSKFTWPVALLRQFRDHFLLANRPGQAFVAFYYHNSPPIADFIAGNELLKVIVRIALLPLVGIAFLSLNPMSLILILLVLISVYWWKSKQRTC